MVSKVQTLAATRLQSVQVLRGVAALLVLIFHTSAVLVGEEYKSTRTFGAFWEQGYAGVDMFFVISGFIMVYVTQGQAPSAASAAKFLYGRITRVYPLWWIFAILMMIYFWISYQQPAPPDRINPNDVLAYSIKSLLLIPQEHYPVLVTGWTLIHEILFYIIFAAGLLLPRKSLPVWLGLWTVLIIGVSLIAPSTSSATNYWQLLTSPFNLEFIFGAALACYLNRYDTKGSAGVLLLGLIGFAATMIIGLNIQHTAFLWGRVLAYGLSSMLILYGAIGMERSGKLRLPRFFIHLGDWSYSLYLSHLLVVLTLSRVWKSAESTLPAPIKLGATGIIDDIIFILVVLTLSIITASISYRVIEKPALKLLRRKP